MEVLAPQNSLVLLELDLGETEAITLAIEVHAEILLVDEQKAIRHGLRVAGTLSALDEADRAGLVNFGQAVAQLRKTSFRVSQAVVSEIRQRRLR